MPPERTITFSRKPIRILIDEDGIWLAAHDIFAAARLKTDRNILAHFDPEHLKLLTFQSEAGPIRLTAVSPLGAATIAKYLHHPTGRFMDSWVRRVTGELADEFGLPRLTLSLLADWSFPVKPRVASANYLPWHDLRWLYTAEPRRPKDTRHPALFDEDPSIPPHDPDKVSATIGTPLEFRRKEAPFLSPAAQAYLARPSGAVSA